MLYLRFLPFDQKPMNLRIKINPCLSTRCVIVHNDTHVHYAYILNLVRKNKKMKNAKNIQKITTSLFLAVTLVLGSVSFAVPGIMPSAFAATENLVVSADNNLFDKSFNGPMVIEIVVNDNDIDEDNRSRT